MLGKMRSLSELKYKQKTCLTIFTKWSRWTSKTKALRELETLYYPRTEEAIVRKYFYEFFYRFRKRVILKHRFEQFGLTRLSKIQTRHFVAWYYLFSG